MSPPRDDGEQTDDGRERPEVPEGVIRGIDDFTDGRTVGSEELERMLDD